MADDDDDDDNDYDAGLLDDKLARSRMGVARNKDKEGAQPSSSLCLAVLRGRLVRRLLMRSCYIIHRPQYTYRVRHPWIFTVYV